MAFSTDARVTAANILPPLFVCSLAGTMWSIHAGLHLRPMLQHGKASEFDAACYTKGVWQTVVSQILTVMFAICFVRSVLGKPGSVPDAPEWKVGGRGSLNAALATRELKNSNGDRRVCKWCQKYKPDRCHHCRICKTCVLKMDHHCPWIMNCVGFGNHKYFFLLAVYAVANCIFIGLTISESVQRSMVEETSSRDRFVLVLGMVLAMIMGFLMSFFLAFHTWLMFNGMTTIEFCEKSLPKIPNSRSISYHCGYYDNAKAVLGPRWWLWLLPLSPPEGNGMNFSLPMEDEKPEWTGRQGSTP